MMGQNTRMESKKEVGVEVKVRTMVGGEGKVRSWLDVVKGKKEETKKQGNNRLSFRYSGLFCYVFFCFTYVGARSEL